MRICTATGRFYTYGATPSPPLDPWREIAAPLSWLARFLGHFGPWTVAAHQVACCRLARALALGPLAEILTLWHDAHEALVGDRPAPLGRWLRHANGGDGKPDWFKAAAMAADRACFAALIAQPEPYWAAPAILDAAVRRADLAVLEAERVVLLPDGCAWDPTDSDPDDVAIAVRIVDELVHPNRDPLRTYGPDAEALLVAEHEYTRQRNADYYTAIGWHLYDFASACSASVAAPYDPTGEW